MVDRISSDISTSSFSAIFEDNEAVIRMIIKSRGPNLRLVSRTHRVDLDWLIERINLDSSILIRHVRATEQVTLMSTKSASTTSSDTDRPSDLKVDHSQSETSCSVVSQAILLAMSNAYSSQRDFESGLWEEKPEDSSCGVRSAWERTDS